MSSVHSLHPQQVIWTGDMFSNVHLWERLHGQDQYITIIIFVVAFTYLLRPLWENDLRVDSSSPWLWGTVMNGVTVCGDNASFTSFQGARWLWLPATLSNGNASKGLIKWIYCDSEGHFLDFSPRGLWRQQWFSKKSFALWRKKITSKWTNSQKDSRWSWKSGDTRYWGDKRLPSPLRDTHKIGLNINRFFLSKELCWTRPWLANKLKTCLITVFWN